MAENALILERMRVRTDPRQIIHIFSESLETLTLSFFCVNAMCRMMARESEEV